VTPALISVIIPALEEEEALPGCLASVAAQAGPLEVIVVDGGSRDRTTELARAAGAAVLSCPPGRARQLNSGARAARGEVLLFLHADSRLPPGALAALRRAAARGARAGAFRMRFDRARWDYRLAGWLGDRYCELTGDLFGDRAMFLDRDLFEELGGFRELDLLEDLELAGRLRRAGQAVTLLTPTVITSSRRADAVGLPRFVWGCCQLLWAFHRGQPAAPTAAAFMRGKRGRAPAAAKGPRPVELLLLARRPEAGRVKTRLARALGAEAACELHAAMARDTWAALRSLSRPAHLATDGAGWLDGATRVWPQRGEGLGERLAEVLEQMAAAGARAVLVIASDTPHLGAARIEEAAAQLEAGAALVASPAEDGGLTLLGLALPASVPLRELPWESDRLDAGLAAAAERAGARLVWLLPGSYDLDTVEDLRRLLAEPAEVRARSPETVLAAGRALAGAAAATGAVRFVDRVGAAGLVKRAPRVLQLNLGDRCNQTCRHCHASGGPDAPTVSRAVLEDTLVVLAREPRLATVDLSGGDTARVPELLWYLEALRPLERTLLFRTNLTSLEGAPPRLLPLLRELGAEVIASLPGLSADEVDAQRGEGVFAGSLEQLRRLNEEGFGAGAATPTLVYNPPADQLPPPQPALEARFREQLGRDHGLRFDRLHVMTNVPIGRLRDELRRAGRLDAYEARLRQLFNPRSLEQLECRETLAVSHDGTLHDCEFNRALGLPLAAGAPRTIHELRERGWPPTSIVLGEHCYACTARAGSS